MATLDILAGVTAAGEAAEEAQGYRDERCQGEERPERALFGEGGGSGKEVVVDSRADAPETSEEAPEEPRV